MQLKRRQFLEAASSLLLSSFAPTILLGKTINHILNIRYSKNKQKIRLVLDLEKQANYTVKQNIDTKSVTIEIFDCVSSMKSFSISDPAIKDISIKQLRDKTVFIINYTKRIKPFLFKLPKDKSNKKLDRLVIDLQRKYGQETFVTKRNYSSNKPLLELIDEDLNDLKLKASEEEDSRLSFLSSKKSDLHYGIKRIVIDAGHGGFDPGAVGKSGLKEKEVALKIAYYLKKLFLTNTDIFPYLTRLDDYYVPLGERTTIANQHRADLFISIHINAAKDSRSQGLETFYCSEKVSDKEASRISEVENSVGKNENIFKEKADFISVEKILSEFERRIYWAESSRFATIVQKKMLHYLKRKNRRVRYANFFVLRRAKMPSLLAEMGFISNKKEEKMLKTSKYQKLSAEAIYSGVMSYIEKNT